MITRLFALMVLVAATLANAPVRAADDAGVPVLMYHRVAPDIPSDAVGRSLTITPQVFDAQLAWLDAHHIHTLTLAELVAAMRRGEHPRNAVVLTFDDGYVDAATYATPLLARHHARASFYVSSGFIGDSRHASWRQLRAMRAAGMEIGCHGSVHRDLSTLDHAEATREVGGCARALTTYLARPTTYAYAAGKATAETFAVVHSAGFDAALTELPGTVTSLAHPYELPRRRVDHDDSLATFGAHAIP